MTVETVDTPAQTPAEAFAEESTSRASERFTDVLPATYDEKDDMDLLRTQLNKRKRPIYAGLAFLCVVVIGVSIAVSSGGGTDANTASGITTPEETISAPTVDDSTTGGVHGADGGSSSVVASGSGSGSNVLGEAANEAGLFSNSSSSSNDTETTTPTTPAPTEGTIYPYKDLGFEWKNPANWEYASGAGVSGAIVNEGGVLVNEKERPIRTKASWGGEKVLFIEWTRSGNSETNIWMLNEVFRGRGQYAPGNEWPFWGELDIFEMMVNEAQKKRALKEEWDFTGFGNDKDVNSYATMTMHTGAKNNVCNIVAPASHTKSMWYQNTAPMTGASAAQFSVGTKSMAVIWGSDGNGQFIQLSAGASVTKGGKINDQQTYDLVMGGVTTMKIYNNNALHWGTPLGSRCVGDAGHNAATGFPFFENFFLVLEEQGGGSFTLTNLQVFKK